MQVRRFAIADARFERSPGQDADIDVANVVDQRDGAPITIGYGRYGPDQRLAETMAVDDVMIVLEGQLTVTSDDAAVIAGPGDIVHMPNGRHVSIHAGAQGAITAYVTYPHWQEARN